MAFDRKKYQAELAEHQALLEKQGLVPSLTPAGAPPAAASPPLPPEQASVAGAPPLLPPAINEPPSPARPPLPVAEGPAPVELHTRLEALERTVASLVAAHRTAPLERGVPGWLLAAAGEASAFDKFSGAREHIGIRTMPHTKTLVRQLQAHLNLRTLAAALDYSVAFAAAGLLPGAAARPPRDS